MAKMCDICVKNNRTINIGVLVVFIAICFFSVSLGQSHADNTFLTVHVNLKRDNLVQANADPLIAFLEDRQTEWLGIGCRQFIENWLYELNDGQIAPVTWSRLIDALTSVSLDLRMQLPQEAERKHAVPGITAVLDGDGVPVVFDCLVDLFEEEGRILDRSWYDGGGKYVVFDLGRHQYVTLALSDTQLFLFLGFNQVFKNQINWNPAWRLPVSSGSIMALQLKYKPWLQLFYNQNDSDCHEMRQAMKIMGVDTVESLHLNLFAASDALTIQGMINGMKGYSSPLLRMIKPVSPEWNAYPKGAETDLMSYMILNVKIANLVSEYINLISKFDGGENAGLENWLDGTLASVGSGIVYELLDQFEPPLVRQFNRNSDRQGAYCEYAVGVKNEKGVELLLSMLVAALNQDGENSIQQVGQHEWSVEVGTSRNPVSLGFGLEGSRLFVRLPIVFERTGYIEWPDDSSVTPANWRCLSKHTALSAVDNLGLEWAFWRYFMIMQSDEWGAEFQKLVRHFPKGDFIEQYWGNGVGGIAVTSTGIQWNYSLLYNTRHHPQKGYGGTRTTKSKAVQTLSQAQAKGKRIAVRQPAKKTEGAVPLWIPLMLLGVFGLFILLCVVVGGVVLVILLRR